MKYSGLPLAGRFIYMTGATLYHVVKTFYEFDLKNTGRSDSCPHGLCKEGFSHGEGNIVNLYKVRF